MTVRVMVVDEQSIVRNGLTVILEQDPDLSVVGEADTALGALALARELRPDVVLMEIRMSTGDAISVLSRLVAETPAPRVLVITNVEVADCVFDSLRAGAAGFVLKRSSPDRILAAVRAVVDGGMPIDPMITPKVVDSYFRRCRHEVTRTPALCALSDRERDIVRLLAQGLGTDEVARTLRVSRTTVKTHVSHVLAKWGLRDRVQLVARAYESGFVHDHGTG